MYIVLHIKAWYMYVYNYKYQSSWQSIPSEGSVLEINKNHKNNFVVLLKLEHLHFHRLVFISWKLVGLNWTPFFKKPLLTIPF